MKIPVDYIDTNGNQHDLTFRMSRLAFVKHLAMVGQRYLPKPHKLMRTVGMFYHYSHYMQLSEFYNNRFSEPPKQLSDPTEKGQFSTLAGKAIADYLSKRIDQSLFTVNYEAALRLNNMKVNVRRPDLIAYTQNSQFAIECKGYSKGSGNMTNHKTQSKTGGIPVNYTIACVSHNLYKEVKCKYHDPFNESVEYDNVSLQALTRNYYHGLLEFINQEYFEYHEIELQGEKFYEVELPFQNFDNLFTDMFPFRVNLILPSKIRTFAEKGLTNNIKPFIYDTKRLNIKEWSKIYIDNDRVGLRLEKK